MPADLTSKRLVEFYLTLNGQFAKLADLGGVLRCVRCNTDQPLGDLAHHMSQGWPHCCGHVMSWITQRELEALKS